MGETGNEIEQDIEEPVGTNLQSGNWLQKGVTHLRFVDYDSSSTLNKKNRIEKIRGK